MGAMESERGKQIKQCKAIIDGESCIRTVVADGHCDPHYRHVKNGGQPRKIRFVRVANATLERNEDGHKYCIYAAHWVDPSLFYKGNATADGLQIACIECTQKMSIARHIRAPEIRRKAQLLRRYGISVEDFERMLERQDGRCAICKRTEPGTRGWHVDHDHSHHEDGSGCPDCVRGILCSLCNNALGMVNDSTEILNNMISYLRGWKEGK